MQKIEPLFAGRGERYIVLIIFQAVLQSAGELRFIFDNQDMHPFFHIARLSTAAN
jgi:hypothetical protein